MTYSLKGSELKSDCILMNFIILQMVTKYSTNHFSFKLKCFVFLPINLTF